MKPLIPQGGLLSLDWGGAKTGYATCDELGLVIAPQGSFPRKSRHRPWEITESDRQHLRALIKKFEPGALLLGLPLNADGSESEASQKARGLATELHVFLKLEVLLVSEILTSWASKSAKNEDAAAAALLIQDYLSEKGISK